MVCPTVHKLGGLKNFFYLWVYLVLVNCLWSYTDLPFCNSTFQLFWIVFSTRTISYCMANDHQIFQNYKSWTRHSSALPWVHHSFPNISQHVDVLRAQLLCQTMKPGRFWLELVSVASLPPSVLFVPQLKEHNVLLKQDTVTR